MDADARQVLEDALRDRGVDPVDVVGVLERGSRPPLDGSADLGTHLDEGGSAGKRRHLRREGHLEATVPKGKLELLTGSGSLSISPTTGIAATLKVDAFHLLGGVLKFSGTRGHTDPATFAVSRGHKNYMPVGFLQSPSSD